MAGLSAEAKRELRLKEKEDAKIAEQKRREELDRKREENIRRRAVEKEKMQKQQEAEYEFKHLRAKQLEIRRLENIQRKEELRLRRLAQQELKARANADSKSAAVLKTVTTVEKRMRPPAESEAAGGRVQTSSAVADELDDPELMFEGLAPADALKHKQMLIRKYEEELERLRLEERHIEKGLKTNRFEYVEERFAVVKKVRDEEEAKREKEEQRERAAKAGLLSDEYGARKGTKVEEANHSALLIQKMFRGYLGRQAAKLQVKLNRMQAQIRNEEDRIRQIYTRIDDARIAGYKSEAANARLATLMTEKALSRATEEYRRGQGPPASKDTKKLSNIYGVTPQKGGGDKTSARKVGKVA